MKKRLLAILLSALLMANISACSYVPENDIEPTTDAASTESDTSNTENSVEDTSEIDTETKPSERHPNFFNGVWGNSNTTYTFNQNGELSVHIADWDENHLFTSLADENIAVSKYFDAPIGVNNERAFLLLKRYDENKITVVNFEKGSQSETVVNLDADEDVYEICGNFINENIGYIFAFSEVFGYHARGSSKLSHFFKTEDGGKTWDSINIQNVPPISLQNYIMFAKMISEDVGLISGNIFGADYDFCERTLLTTDGGLNWVHVNILELPENDDLHWATVSEFSQVEDAYVLTIRYETPDGNYDYAKYKLSDLNTWIRTN